MKPTLLSPSHLLVPSSHYCTNSAISLATGGLFLDFRLSAGHAYLASCYICTTMQPLIQRPTGSRRRSPFHLCFHYAFISIQPTCVLHPSFIQNRVPSLVIFLPSHTLPSSTCPLGLYLLLRCSCSLFRLLSNVYIESVFLHPVFTYFFLDSTVLAYATLHRATPSLGFVSFIDIQLYGLCVRSHNILSWTFPSACAD